MLRLLLFGLIIPQYVAHKNLENASEILRSEIKQNDFAFSVIKYVFSGNIILVNFDHNTIVKKIHDSIQYSVITRNFLSTELDVSNTAYLLQFKNYIEFKEGLLNLKKDRFWNPTAIFICIVTHLLHKDEVNIFQKFHYHNAFKIILVSSLDNSVYLYNFDVSNHCVFTPEAITKYADTELRFNKHTEIIKEIKRSVERTKVPYSQCNLTFIISSIVPYIMSSAKENDHGSIDQLTGFETIFITTLKEKFSHITIIHKNGADIGFVSQNFTVFGLLKYVEDGEADGIIGGLALSPIRTSGFDVTCIHWFDNLDIITPERQKIDKWRAMFKTFGYTEWILILTSYFITCLVDFVLTVYGKKENNTFFKTMLNTFGYLVGNTHKINECNSSRMLVLSWVLFTWFISSFYQSELLSVFTRPRYYRQVTPQEALILKYKLYFNIYHYNAVKATSAFGLEEVINNANICPDMYDCLEQVAKGGKRFTYSSRMHFLYYKHDFYYENGESKLHYSNAYGIPLQIVAYFRKGNPNLEIIRYIENQVIAHGIHHKGVTDLVYAKKIKNHFKGDIVQALKWNDVKGQFYLLFFGQSASIIVFLLEKYVSVYVV